MSFLEYFKTALPKFPGAYRPQKELKVDQLLESKKLEKFCHRELAAGIAAEPSLGPRLAMFGRMVVADALLEIRDSVDLAKVLPNPVKDDCSRSCQGAVQDSRAIHFSADC